MELLVRWPCPCVPPPDQCVNCNGKGYLERWIPQDLLRPLLGDSDFLIINRRHAESNSSHVPVALEQGRETSPASTLFVDGLPPSFNSTQLREVFEAVGTVLWSRVVVDATGQCSGFGYVDMETSDQAQTAAKALDGYKVGDHSVAVMISYRAPQALQAERFLQSNVGKAFCELCVRSHVRTAASSTELLDAFSYLYECSRSMGLCSECRRATQVFAARLDSLAQG